MMFTIQLKLVINAMEYGSLRVLITAQLVRCALVEWIIIVHGRFVVLAIVIISHSYYLVFIC